MRLLVFDDDEATGRLVVRVATLLGYQTDSVCTADDFLGHIVGQTPDVVVLDLQLGSTDGIEQLRLLAKRQFAGWLVLISGFDTRVLSSARGIANSFGLKVKDVLAKPLRLETLETVLREVLAIEEPLTPERIRQAILANELILELQPIVRRHPRRLLKLEALVRWNHPVRGKLAPSVFLKVAEADVPTIDALTLWVVEASAKAFHTLASSGVSVPLSMNVSARNLHDVRLPDRIESCLRAGRMPLQNLHLEVTESAAFDELNITLDILSRARLKGMSLAIDDFGTGYASLRILHQVPYCEVKIDRTFVESVAHNSDARAIVKSTADLASELGLNCVAEGVASEDIALEIEKLGITDLQGYGISPPLQIEAVAPWFAAWSSAEAVALAGERKPAPSTAVLPNLAVVGSTIGKVMPSQTLVYGDIRLPPRQIQVMRLLSEGKSVKEIARDLNLGLGTIKVHLSLAYSSLGARNKVEAINRAAPLLAKVTEARTHQPGTAIEPDMKGDVLFRPVLEQALRE